MAKSQGSNLTILWTPSVALKQITKIAGVKKYCERTFSMKYIQFKVK